MPSQEVLLLRLELPLDPGRNVQFRNKKSVFTCFQVFVLLQKIYSSRAFIDPKTALKAFQIHQGINKTLLFFSNAVKLAKR